MLPSVTFTFAAIARHKNILLPAHIAQQEYGMLPEEAAEAGGMVDCEAERKYEYDASIGMLHCCESYVYYDMDGESISEVCSCAPEDEEEVTYVNVEIVDDEEYGLSAPIVFSETPKQHAYFHLRERSTHEPMSILDIESAKESWSAALDLDEQLEEDAYIRLAADALQVVRLTKRALLIQAGVSPDKLK